MLACERESHTWWMAKETWRIHFKSSPIHCNAIQKPTTYRKTQIQWLTFKPTSLLLWNTLSPTKIKVLIHKVYGHLIVKTLRTNISEQSHNRVADFFSSNLLSALAYAKIAYLGAVAHYFCVVSALYIWCCHVCLCGWMCYVTALMKLWHLQVNI